MGGGLIQAAVGNLVGSGMRCLKRLGVRAKAAAMVAWRCCRTSSARPVCTLSGVIIPMPECRCSWLYQVKNGEQYARASASEPKRAGKPGWYFNVLNCASEYGLSSEM